MFRTFAFILLSANKALVQDPEQGLDYDILKSTLITLTKISCQGDSCNTFGNAQENPKSVELESFKKH